MIVAICTNNKTDDGILLIYTCFIKVVKSSVKKTFRTVILFSYFCYSHGKNSNFTPRLAKYSNEGNFSYRGATEVRKSIPSAEYDA